MLKGQVFQLQRQMTYMSHSMPEWRRAHLYQSQKKFDPTMTHTAQLLFPYWSFAYEYTGNIRFRL